MLPDTHSFVFPSTSHPKSIRTPINCKYFILVTGQVRVQLLRPYIPDLECGVFRGAHKESGIRRESTLIYCGNMATKRGYKGAIARIPKLNVIVEGRGCKVAAIRRESDMVYKLLVTCYFQERISKLLSALFGVLVLTFEQCWTLPSRRFSGFVLVVGSHRYIVKSSLAVTSLSTTTPPIFAAFSYRSRATLFLSPSGGVFPVWSKYPVLSTWSVDKAR